jgi:uncharacterized membrane protein
MDGPSLIPPTNTPTLVPPVPSHDPVKDVEENKDLAALSYFWVLSVIVYMVRGDSPFVRFHAKQAMVLFVLSIIVWFVPVVGKGLELLVLGVAALGFIGAAQGEWKELPLIGALSRGDKQGVRRSWKSFTSMTADRWRKHATPSHVDTKPSKAQHSSEPSTPKT